MADAAPTPKVITLADVVKRRRELAETLELELKQVKDKYTDKLKTIDAWLLKYLVDNKTKTQATEFGTVMTYKRRGIKVADFNNFKSWAELNDKEEFIKHDVDSTEVLAYLDASAAHQLPDGLRMDTTDVLSVKAPK